MKTNRAINYLADQHQSYYDRDFGAVRYDFEARGDGCCYYDDDSDADDSYNYSDSDCDSCYGDSRDNSWKVGGYQGAWLPVAGAGGGAG